MKDYSSKKRKIGKPAYRTPSRLIYQKSQVKKQVPRAWDLATRLEHRRVNKGKRK